MDSTLEYSHYLDTLARIIHDATFFISSYFVSVNNPLNGCSAVYSVVYFGDILKQDTLI